MNTPFAIYILKRSMASYIEDSAGDSSMEAREIEEAMKHTEEILWKHHHKTKTNKLESQS